MGGKKKKFDDSFDPDDLKPADLNITSPIIPEYYSATDIETKSVGVADNYLPAVLVRLKITGNNAEARSFIRNTGIKVDGEITKSCDATNAKEQFELEIGNVVYQIFKVD